MSVTGKSIFRALLCVVPILCASCLSMSLPKSAKLEPSSGMPTASAPSVAGNDRALVDKWELLLLVNDKGGEEKPRDATRTLIEFTDKGQVILNRVDKEGSDALKSRTGKYTTAKNEVSITDDKGNTSVWPYQVTGDQLVLVMPELNKKFHWRRYR